MHLAECVFLARRTLISQNNSTLGNISTKEAKYALKSLGLDVKKDEIQAAVVDEEESVDFATFARLAKTKLVQREKALTAFQLFDKDNKGVICLQDLQRVSHELGENFTGDQLEEMLEQADKSGECLLGQEDFLHLARKVNL